MRKLAVNTFLTLDGVMQAPGGPEEDPSGGFKHGGWSVNYWDDMMGDVMGEQMSSRFDLLLGRKTYELFARYWPQHADQPGGKPLNDATKYVASRGRPTLEWERSVLIEGDLDAAREIAEAVDGAELFLYPGDKHLFADDSLPSYDEGAATLLMQRVLDFLGAV